MELAYFADDLSVDFIILNANWEKVLFGERELPAPHEFHYHTYV